MLWNLKSDRPIYSQLIEQIELGIVSGIYPAGSRLPSVRDMAHEALVNPNTMQRALSQLEVAELLFSKRTSGRFVTENVEKIMDTKNNLAMGLVEDFIKNMGDLGYDGNKTISLIKSITGEEK